MPDTLDTRLAAFPASLRELGAIRSDASSGGTTLTCSHGKLRDFTWIRAASWPGANALARTFLNRPDPPELPRPSSGAKQTDRSEVACVEALGVPTRHAARILQTVLWAV